MLVHNWTYTVFVRNPSARVKTYRVVIENANIPCDAFIAYSEAGAHRHAQARIRTLSRSLLPHATRHSFSFTER